MEALALLTPASCEAINRAIRAWTTYQTLLASDLAQVDPWIVDRAKAHAYETFEDLLPHEKAATRREMPGICS